MHFREHRSVCCHQAPFVGFWTCPNQATLAMATVNGYRDSVEELVFSAAQPQPVSKANLFGRSLPLEGAADVYTLGSLHGYMGLTWELSFLGVNE